MLERRALLLGVLRAALSERDVLVRIGSENEAPALQSLALVAAGYGLPPRKLGTVSVIGPVRMDYAGRDPHRARGRRGSCRGSSRTLYEAMSGTVPRDPYEVLGVARDADETTIKKAFRKLARELHPDVNAPRPRRRGEVQGGRRGLRDPQRRRAPRDLRPLRPRGPALAAAWAPNFERLRLDQRPVRRVLRRHGLRRHGRAARPARVPGRRHRRDRRRSRSRRRRPASERRADVRGDRDLRALPRQRRRARDADRDLRALRRRRRCCRRSRARRSGRSCAASPATCAAARARCPSSRASAATAAGARCAGARCASTSRRASPTASASGSAGAATPASAGGPPGDLYVLVHVRERRALPARRRRPRHGRSTSPRRSPRWARSCRSEGLDGEDIELEIPAGTQPGEVAQRARRRHARAAAPRPRAATCASSSTCRSRASSTATSASCSSSSPTRSRPEQFARRRDAGRQAAAPRCR